MQIDKDLVLKIFKIFNISLGAILLAATLINIGSALHRTSVPKGILFSVDNDAGRAIQTAQLSRWYKSNHFAPYGNLYFRFAHTIAKLAPGYNFDHLSEGEKDEAIHHFALKLTSLLALTLLCLWIAWLLTHRWEFALGATVILLRCFMYDENLVKYVFRAHPDHLLMLATALAVYFTYRYINERSEKNYKISALLWGIGFAVKTSLVLFIPSLVAMFFQEGLKKETLKKGIKFVGFMLLSYFLIGFPQNFGFVKHIRFLLSESHNSQPADLDSIAWYSTLLWNQLKYVLIPVLVLHLFWGERKVTRLPGILLFTGIALIVLYARKMMSISEHHTFPHSGMLLMFYVVLVQFIPAVNLKYRSIAFTFILIVTSYFITGKSTAVTKVYTDQNNCIPESFDFLAVVRKHQGEKKVFARDPYVPFDSSTGKRTRQFWGLTFGDIKDSKASLFGTNSNFASRYIADAPPEFWSDAKKKGFSDKNLFYKSLIGKNQLETPTGETFLKIYENTCGHALWIMKEEM